jgi:protein arginine N-methyltransferase 1
VSEHSRIYTFQRALEACVNRGDVVCEIGAGLGTYSFLASRAGASRVYAIEEGPVIDIAKKLYAANREDVGTIEFIHQHSKLVELPEKVDIVIYENFGSLGLTPVTETVLKDAFERFLKPGGTFVPNGMKLYLAAIQANKIWEETIACLKKDNEKVMGLDYSLLRHLSVNERIKTSEETDALLCEPLVVHSLNFNECQELSFSHELEIEMIQPGILHGFGCWIDFDFPGGYTYSQAYNKPATYSRSFFPMPQPVAVQPGESIHMHFSVMNKPLSDHTWTWWGEIIDRKGKIKTKWNSSTLHLLPFQSHDINLPKSFDAGYHPNLNKEGHIRKFILEQMDGRETIHAIAHKVIEQFPDEFSSLSEAFTKVVRIVKKCAL